MTTTATDAAAFSDADVPIPLWRQRLKVFMGNKLAIASCIYVIVLTIVCFIVPHVHPTNQTNQAIAFNTPQNEAPSGAHLLGTDSNGFDELGRIFYGGEYSLTLGFGLLWRCRRCGDDAFY
jgi:peptide/nickel transport system permease protein